MLQKGKCKRATNKSENWKSGASDSHFLILTYRMEFSETNYFTDYLLFVKIYHLTFKC